MDQDGNDFAGTNFSYVSANLDFSTDENLAPLVRFLRSRLGRHWDSVYSELCEGLRPDSTVQKHVLDHLWDFVAVRTGVVEGAVYAHFRSDTFVRLADTRFSPRFYVCPKTGCLRDVRALREKARRSKRSKRKAR